MLRLYAGRENIDKERFTYDRVRERGGETLVLVPDQYTLVAEEQALRLLGTDCLFNVEILSMNRLGLRVLTEKGEESVRMLDKYGRFMLLGKLIREHAGELDIFRKAAGKKAFTEMLNDFISRFKQQDCDMDKVREMLDDDSADPLLRAKLSEITGVLEAYEEAIRGRYTDSEDQISRYVEAIGGSQLLRGKTVWIYGYDSITPKFRDAVFELASVASEVGFVVNRSDFGLDELMITMLREEGSRRGTAVSCEEIGPEYAAEKAETIARIEKGLWDPARIAGEAAANAEFVPEGLTLVRAANPYHEAENAAAFIWHLVRDRGYRLRDIQVIANDEGGMQPIVRRTFEEYGLPVFADQTRDITDTPAVAFIVSLLMFIVRRKVSQHLFMMLKTGLAGVDAADIFDLENYARSYRIIGSMWDKDFRYGEDEIGAERFAALNSLRGGIMAKVAGLEELVRTRGTVGEFVPEFRAYLRDTWKLDEAVETAALEMEEEGLHDEAQRNVQSYAKALEIMDQIVEILGDEKLDLAEFTEIYAAGLAEVSVGVIPPAADGLSLGTMIRTRPRPVRAAVILGANEGVLPLQPSSEGLFSEDDKKYFTARGFALGALDDIKAAEENAAMYRMLSKPSDELYISWAMTDAAGADADPSPLIEQLTTLFPQISARGLIKRDMVSAGWSLDLIQAPVESMRHLVGRIKDRSSREAETGRAPDDSLTRALLRWFSEERAGELDVMLRAAADDNVQEPLSRETARRLLAARDGSLPLSASSISSYFDCPFRYFIDRGLRPEEEREFSADPRSVGDVYHDCLMRVAQRLIGDRDLLDRLADGGDDELEQLLDEELGRISREYRGGLFVSAGSEEFRMERIREIIRGAARAMITQLTADALTGADFEERFHRGCKFPPIRFEVDGTPVYVEGKIDRADFLDVDGSSRVRIIDYKTGSDKLDLGKMRSGYKMQLMIYMISASSGDLEPAGLYYFNIRDPIERIDGKSEKSSASVTSRAPENIYALRGVYVNEPGVLGAMPPEVLQSKEKAANISREEFEETRADVLDRIRETAEGILGGRIDISPLRDNNRLSCGWCDYKPICRRDREYTRNRPRDI